MQPQVPIPDHMDLYHLHEEAAPSDMSALDAVVDYIRTELKKLETLEEKILQEFGPEDERLTAIYERMEELDPSTFEVDILYWLRVYLRLRCAENNAKPLLCRFVRLSFSMALASPRR